MLEIFRCKSPLFVQMSRIPSFPTFTTLIWPVLVALALPSGPFVRCNFCEPFTKFLNCAMQSILDICKFLSSAPSLAPFSGFVHPCFLRPLFFPEAYLLSLSLLGPVLLEWTPGFCCSFVAVHAARTSMAWRPESIEVQSEASDADADESHDTWRSWYDTRPLEEREKGSRKRIA